MQSNKREKNTKINLKHNIKHTENQITTTINSKLTKNAKIYESHTIFKVKNSFFSRLTKKLNNTRKKIISNMYRIFSKQTIDNKFFKSLEEELLLADVGVYTANIVIKNLIKIVNSKKINIPNDIYFLLQQEMYKILKKVEKKIIFDNFSPFVILVIGVNGVGKTTTIAKLAKKYQLSGKSVLLAAGDTFRAAAAEQLKDWGKKNSIPVISKPQGSDSASVIYDAFQAAKARDIDILISDTSGRLHNKSYLLEELKKIIKVIKKLDCSAPHEIMLIIDACNGQNAILQAETFFKHVGITGITLTKLDGTAKGGVIFSIANKISIPIRYIGVGERDTDLYDFSSHDFVTALFRKNIE